MIGESVNRFVERLSSADPTPGGGSAAALAGALAAALTAMIARLSAGRGGDDALDALFEQSMRTGDQVAAALLELVDRDAEAFDRVMAAMRLPRGSDEEKGVRTEAVQDALHNATAVPLMTAEQAMLVLALTPELARQGNPRAVSDVGVAAVLAHAAVSGALLNVAINLKSLKDAGYREETRARAAEIQQRADDLRTLAMDLVNTHLA